MDIDLTKPLYIFILDTSTSGEITPLPKSLLRRCSQPATDVIDVAGHDKPLPAIRGSTTAFGSWSKEGKLAIKIAPDQYAILINEYIPSLTQYKWLDLSGKGLLGDVDPDTGYCYEPAAFVNRSLQCTEPKPGEEIVILVEKWADYKSNVTKSSLEEWVSHSDTIDEEDEEDIKTSEVTESPLTASSANTKPEVSVTTHHYSSTREKYDEDKDEDTKNGEENNLISEVIVDTEIIEEVKVNKTSLSPGETKADIDNNNMNLKNTQDDNINVKDVESVFIGDEVISEVTSKRMIKISESEAPETDQVLKVIVCDEASTVDITQMSPNALSSNKI